LNFYITKRRLLLTAVLILLIAIAVWAVWVFLAFGNATDKRSNVTVERREWYQIEVDGKPLLYFSDRDTTELFRHLSEQRDTAIMRTRSFGHWANRLWLLPSCRGRIVADMDSLTLPDIDTQKELKKKAELVKKELRDRNTMAHEMDYFFSVHNVQDEGYMLVTAEYESNIKEAERLGSVLTRLNEAISSSSVKITRQAEYRAVYKDASGKLQRDTCVFDDRMFRLKNSKTPKGAKAISFISRQNLGLSYIKSVVPHPLTIVPDGFALRITPEKGVQLGEWREGRYRGERLEYNSHRIYGIDISRFQHEAGRRRYNINWKKMRITSLGTISQKRIRGKVDYPVSFIYIKSTEGTNIRNRYYASDYLQARRNGLRTGTYHFFSTRTPALKQAEWFFRNSKYSKGDLPPVLDVEPSNAQIKQMGGVDVLFREVRTWLKAVESRWGVKPILYINQLFVNRHLPEAPDIKENYEVWIARYGEYKPDVHMVYWQLSPDGRVAGIVPHVDINVFNGYADKYEKFISEHAKK
jgi:lysozyme